MRNTWVIFSFLAVALAAGCAGPAKRSSVLLRQGRYAEARDLARTVKPSDPDLAGAYFVQAQAAYALGDLADTLAKCSVCLNIAGQRLSETPSEFYRSFNQEMIHVCGELQVVVESVQRTAQGITTAEKQDPPAAKSGHE
jgi:hypothetical protein